MREVNVAPRSIDGFRQVLESGDYAGLEDALEALRSATRARTIWHVNSAANGGGVAEILGAFLPYAACAGIAVHWLVIEGDAQFFEVTKRIHNRLHEQQGDGGPLDRKAREVYDANLAKEIRTLRHDMRAGDIAVLHDPQTAGMIPALTAKGVHVVWRCHVGVDAPGELARSTWSFLRRDVQRAEACVFSRASYIWSGLRDAVVMAPCIDVLSEKNRPLEPAQRDAILQRSGVMTNGARPHDQTAVENWGNDPIPQDARLVVQVSRWDRLKDAVGVLHAFALHMEQLPEDSHLVLAGPNIGAVDDDPESFEAFTAVREAWDHLSASAQRRTHLLRIAMDDPVENARIVNALQGRADVVVQKSLVEGFGLTVAEAMWKKRPVVASRVGGIQDQVEHDSSGILLDDPRDGAAFARAIAGLLSNNVRSTAMGEAAHRRVCDNFLPLHHFRAEAALFERLLA